MMRRVCLFDGFTYCSFVYLQFAFPNKNSFRHLHLTTFLLNRSPINATSRCDVNGWYKHDPDIRSSNPDRHAFVMLH